MTAASKNVYIDKLIVGRYNNTYHRTIKMKSAKYKPGMYVAYGVEHNSKDAKFKVDNYVRISKSKNIFSKDYTPNRLRKSWWSRKQKTLYLGQML